jgi:hypothetical protein
MVSVRVFVDPLCTKSYLPSDSRSLGSTKLVGLAETQAERRGKRSTADPLRRVREGPGERRGEGVIRYGVMRDA